MARPRRPRGRQHGVGFGAGEADSRGAERAPGDHHPDQAAGGAARVASGDIRETPAPLATVGIGASAGGLDAFTRLLRGLPSGTGLAYILVQHLDPTHRSVLPELLARAANVPVVHATDGMRIEADHAYVIPPNTVMTVTDGHLRLAPRGKGRGPHLPIDTFLTSLAHVHGSGAVGVILSGSGSDGARGIAAIKEAGGITIVQESASAQYPSMAQHAIDTGAVDFILAPEEIAAQLARLASHLARHPAEASPDDAPLPPSDEEELQRILGLLRKRTGVDFQHYRIGTVSRRVLRRMLVHRQESRSEYLAHIRENPAELDALYQDLLIGVTSFFRDPEVFSTLKESGLPELMRERETESPLRVWVAGCATGEEAYSVAIVLLEYLGDSATQVPIQIFGTDLSERSIATARAGWYPASIAEHVSPERLARFFIAEQDGYRIRKSVRDLCVFSRHNVVRDPPFSHLDLVSCRNVMIYLSSTLQRHLLPIFHYALEPGGLLVLGAAESVGPGSQLFTPLSKRHRIFRVRPDDVGTSDLAQHSFDAGASYRTTPRRRTLRRPPVGALPEEIEAEADRLVLARFSPPGVVVNEDMEVVHFRGDTRPFLMHAPGLASLQLFRLVRPELAMPLRAALRKSGAEGHPMREVGIALTDGDTLRRVSIEVMPFRSASAGARHFVVLFQSEADVPQVAEPSVAEPAARGEGRGERREVSRLRQEVETTRRYLQDLVEEHEAATEELRAANEEIQSSNEELQSTNEELETTKEEVQSANEELTTLNEELHRRNDELMSLSSDLTNVLTSTTIPIVIIDRELTLRRFTPAAARVMKVIPTDAGRSLGDVKLRFDLPDLERRIRRTVDALEADEVEVQDHDGRWWSIAIRPYLTIDRRIDGAVLVFTDIDASRRLADLAREAAEARGELLVMSEQGRLMAEEARAVAEHANAAKGLFLASMSHDLRTPLNAIAGYTELIELGLRGPVTDMQLIDLSRIKRSARHLLSLINDILNFAKLESGTLQLHIASVSTASIVAELEELVAPQLLAKSLRFERSAGDAMVLVDPEKLRQILLNLLTNAIKFTEPGGCIGVTFTRAGARVQLEITDTGIGIPAHMLERIFDPFIQVDRTLTSPPPDGVGLGLAISRDLARAMSGDLTVESTLGHGSRFVLSLPADIPTAPSTLVLMR